jgi:hypothetical protein
MIRFTSAAFAALACASAAVAQDSTPPGDTTTEVESRQPGQAAPAPSASAAPPTADDAPPAPAGAPAPAPVQPSASATTTAPAPAAPAASPAPPAPPPPAAAPQPGARTTANAPVVDTPENRARYGQPQSRAGKRSNPQGN